jgi:hypothetical protein
MPQRCGGPGDRECLTSDPEPIRGPCSDAPKGPGGPFARLLLFDYPTIVTVDALDRRPFFGSALGLDDYSSLTTRVYRVRFPAGAPPPEGRAAGGRSPPRRQPDTPGAQKGPGGPFARLHLPDFSIVTVDDSTSKTFPLCALGLDGCTSLTTRLHRVRFPAGAPPPEGRAAGGRSPPRRQPDTPGAQKGPGGPFARLPLTDCPHSHGAYSRSSSSHSGPTASAPSASARRRNSRSAVTSMTG